jgi:hypothetical protein
MLGPPTPSSSLGPQEYPHTATHVFPGPFVLTQGTSSLGHVRGSSHSTCAMLCDQSGPKPAMHTMPAQLQPHSPMKPRESALIPFVTIHLPEAGPAYAWQLCRTQEYSHSPTHVFPAHFVLNHAHPGRASRSVTHCSRSSTLNIGVISDGLLE